MELQGNLRQLPDEVVDGSIVSEHVELAIALVDGMLAAAVRKAGSVAHEILHGHFPPRFDLLAALHHIQAA